MRIDLPEWLSGLSARLHDIHSRSEDLPVQGYRPPDGAWRPRPAAVLVALTLDPDPALILTVRSRQLPLHAGQVALPGGGVQGDEAFPLATALREAREEVGLDENQVEVLGLLDRFDTITGYRITPVVGRVRGAVSLKACPQEVREIFRLPLEQALDPTSYRRHEITRNGFAHEAWSMPSDSRLVWGATAAILRTLSTIGSVR